MQSLLPITIAQPKNGWCALTKVSQNYFTNNVLKKRLHALFILFKAVNRGTTDWKKTPEKLEGRM